MIFLLLGFASFASAIVANKILLEVLPSIFFVGIRMLTAGLILVAYSYKSPRFTAKHLILNRSKLLAIPLCTTFIPSLLKAYALKNLPATKATFFGSIDPFIAALLSCILWGIFLNKRQALGILLGFIGTGIVLTATGSSREATSGMWIIFSYPELAALTQVILSRYGWMLAQDTLKKEQYTAAELNGIIMVIGGIYSLITSFSLESLSNICIIHPVYTALLFTYTVIVGNVFGYTIYTAYLKSYSATLVSLTGCSIPLFVQIFSWLFLGEVPSVNLWLALGITFIGIFIFYSSELTSSSV
jgi:drug/metabolite transporter (DMT)-like permease